ncbi:hypothetical protein NHH03_13995 [Stieleria sp. TO1_6]|uniref:hypothetical protein n=1 Tax=Stieleria tagensis TaxID=2956795 RepID=UPI00209BA9D2|nr:hypothetical protein [Stieleria tagensis]MCO8122855.1 hypothetical protein [Stieleria tagensis]
MTPPENASTDQLISWLASCRQSHPTEPLSELLDQASISLPALVELAAVDLIGQRRDGHDRLTEHYLEQFPALSQSESCVLDLLDAELCVRRELGEQQDLTFFIHRFPQLADAIRQLVHLEQPPSEPLDASSDQFLLQRDLTVAGQAQPRATSGSDHQQDDSIDVPIPIKPPEWMVAARCIATAFGESGRYWLVLGRDTQRGDTVAMKVIPLPATLDRTQRTRILDLCELTSSVAHPDWVSPRIAAINNGHLAVIRPWIFGNEFSQLGVQTDPTERLATLVRVAYSLASAHRIGATHGSVIANNVVLDHQSKVNLIDAVSGVSGWQSYLRHWSNEFAQTIDQRIARDTTGLMRLIADQCVNADKPELLEWISRVVRGVDLHDHDACAMIGERLQTLLDQPPRGQRRWWR